MLSSYDVYYREGVTGCYRRAFVAELTPPTAIAQGMDDIDDNSNSQWKPCIIHMPLGLEPRDIGKHARVSFMDHSKKRDGKYIMQFVFVPSATATASCGYFQTEAEADKWLAGQTE